VFEQSICCMSRKKFTTIDAAERLMGSMEEAINNMITEIRKPVDPEINGSARKAELQSIKQTAIDCKELLVERQKLEQMVKDLKSGTFDGEKDGDFSSGWAERNAKK
jgi:hypothetical protein